MFVFSKKTTGNYNLSQIRTKRTGRLVLMVFFIAMSGGVYSDDGLIRRERLAITNIPPKTSICLRKTDYCTATNAVALVEKIIERRCLTMTLWQKWGLSSNSVDAAERANLSEERFENDMRKWLTDVEMYPDEAIPLLTDELDKETERIESLKKSRATISYADYVERLTDEQRYRFLAHQYHYRAKLFNSVTKFLRL